MTNSFNDTASDSTAMMPGRLGLCSTQPRGCHASQTDGGNSVGSTHCVRVGQARDPR